MEQEGPPDLWLAVCNAIAGSARCSVLKEEAIDTTSLASESSTYEHVLPYVVALASFSAFFVGLFYLGQGSETAYEFLCGKIIKTNASKLVFEADKGVTKFNVERGARVWLGNEKGVVLKVFTRGSGSTVRVQLEGFLRRQQAPLMHIARFMVACTTLALAFVFPQIARSSVECVIDALGLAAASCVPSYLICIYSFFVRNRITYKQRKRAGMLLRHNLAFVGAPIFLAMSLAYVLWNQESHVLATATRVALLPPPPRRQASQAPISFVFVAGAVITLCFCAYETFSIIAPQRFDATIRPGVRLQGIFLFTVAIVGIVRCVIFFIIYRQGIFPTVAGNTEMAHALIYLTTTVFVNYLLQSSFSTVLTVESVYLKILHDFMVGPKKRLKLWRMQREERMQFYGALDHSGFKDCLKRVDQIQGAGGDSFKIKTPTYEKIEGAVEKAPVTSQQDDWSSRQLSKSRRDFMRRLGSFYGQSACVVALTAVLALELRTGFPALLRDRFFQAQDASDIVGFVLRFFAINIVLALQRPLFRHIVGFFSNSQQVWDNWDADPYRNSLLALVVDVQVEEDTTGKPKNVTFTHDSYFDLRIHRIFGDNTPAVSVLNNVIDYGWH